MAATCVSCSTWETLSYDDPVGGPTTVYRLMVCAFDLTSSGTSATTILELPPAPAGAASGWRLTWRWAAGIPVTGSGTNYRFWGIVEGNYWDGFGYGAFDASLGATPSETVFTRTSVGDLDGLTLRAATNTNFGASTIEIPTGGYDGGGMEVWYYPNLASGSFPWDGDLIAPSCAGSPPTAAFTGTPLFGPPGTEVVFSDQSTNTPTSWAWDFGDTNTDTVQNPSNIYAADGTYTVELTATNADGSDTETKVAYITIVSPEPGVVLDPTAAEPIPIGEYIVSWRIQRGVGSEVTGGASPGTAVVVVKNTSDLFNPENGASALIDYLHDGTPIWIGVNDDGTLAGADPRGLFGGRIVDITPLPAPGADAVPLVEITCEDALGWMGRVPVESEYVVGRSQAALRASILATAGETRTSLAHEIMTMPLSAADGRSALALLEEIGKANGTRHFVRPENDSADWYSYVTRNRQWRLDGTVDWTLSQLDDHVTSSGGWRLSADTVTNQQRATTTPVKFTPGTYTVWAADPLPLQVTADRPYEVWVEFDDFVQSPVVDSVSSGATPTITLQSTGVSARLTVTVVSGTCTLTHLSIEGALARRLPPESWVANDLGSQVFPRGVRQGSEISGEYVGIMAAARGIAEHIVWRYAQPQVRPTITIENWFPDMFEIQLGDIVAYTSPQIGVTARHLEVVGMTHEGNLAATAAQHHVLTLVLQECRVQADPGWFVLDVSLLDSADILAY